MKSTKYLLVGGGLACSQAARVLRMKDPKGSITLVGREPHLPYDRPPLSKAFLRGEKKRDALFFDRDAFFKEKAINVILGDAVHDLDADRKTVRLAQGDEIAFEKALLGTGGSPIRLRVPGCDLPGVHYLRTLDDAEAIAAAASSGRRAAIVGGGFIGMELAASLTQLGVEVSVIEALPHIWARFLDPSFAAHIEKYCAGRGIHFYTNEKVSQFWGDDRVSSVVTESGKSIGCDFACVAVGIAPDVDIAERAGLEVGDGIVVDTCLRTSHPDIYAAGDVSNYPDPVFGKRRRVEHWGHAEYCGQAAALNMAGQGQAYDLLTYVWSDIFDLHLEFAGDETEVDRVLLRGRFEEPTFTVLLLKDNRLTAYFAVNAKSKEFPPLRRLIRKKIDLTGKEKTLEDPTFDLKLLG